METSHGAETRTRHGNKATRRHGTTEPQGWTHIGPRPPRAFPLPHSLNPNTSVLAARISNTLNKSPPSIRQETPLSARLRK
ncbi:hypothetical protein PCASD_12977 [Puccinia coronata f. sp. avenae]|uniref:Uncharacterized protein n=1 Tax=Puccinia coronata f. sp. avenae TaxID=200324 RepID=A0A2N5UAK7_9BASI|nr:hypothetical protein PCASD_12977 [Puccinia coronata f. sp. avenae]